MKLHKWMEDLGIAMILLLLTGVFIWAFNYYLVPKLDEYTQDVKNFFIFKAISRREKREQEIFDFLMREPIKVADFNEYDNYDFEEEEEEEEETKIEVVKKDDAYLQKKVDRTSALLDMVNNLDIEAIENQFRGKPIKKKTPSLWNQLINAIKDNSSFDYYFDTNVAIIPPIEDEINDFDIENQISTNVIKEKSYKAKRRRNRRELGRDNNIPRVKYKNSTEFYEHQQHFKNIKEQAEMEERIKEHFIYNSPKKQRQRGKRNWKKKILEDENIRKVGWSLTYKQFVGIPKLIMQQLYGSGRKYSFQIANMAKENLVERENKIIPALDELNAHWDSQTFLSSQSKRLKIGYDYKMRALWSHYKEKNGKILKKKKFLRKDKVLSLSIKALKEVEEGED